MSHSGRRGGNRGSREAQLPRTCAPWRPSASGEWSIPIDRCGLVLLGSEPPPRSAGRTRDPPRSLPDRPGGGDDGPCPPPGLTMCADAPGARPGEAGPRTAPRARHPGRPCPEGLEQHDHDPGDRRDRNPRPACRHAAAGGRPRRTGAHPSHPALRRRPARGRRRAGPRPGRHGHRRALRHLGARRRRAGRAEPDRGGAAGRGGASGLHLDRRRGPGAVPYYRTKLAVERQFEDSGTGWTVLRATQFHDLLFRLFQGLSKSPVMPLPARVKDQPVDVRRSRTAWRNWPRAPPPPRGRHGRP